MLVFSSFSIWQGLVILFITLIIAILGTWKWKEILKGQGVGVSFFSLFSPYLAGFALMFLASIMVFGGEVFRAYRLKQKNSVPWPKGMASVIIDRVIEWTTNLAVIVLGAAVFLYNIGLPPKNLFIIFGGFFIAFAIGIGYFYLKIYKRESFVEAIISFFGGKQLKEDSAFFEIENEIFKFFRWEEPQMLKSFAISFLRTGAMLFRVWLLILFLGKDSSFLASLSILGFSYLAAMIPIPTALGSHEAIQAYAFNSLGLGVSTATVFTMIIRGAELILSLAGLIILFRLGFVLINTAVIEKIDSIRKKIQSKNQNK